jgi:hypothetical protein
MSFYKKPNEIPETYGKDAEFYDAEMLLVAFETKPEIATQLFPPPLKPIEPITVTFIANYPKTNFSAVYHEGARRGQGRAGQLCSLCICRLGYLARTFLIIWANCISQECNSN